MARSAGARFTRRNCFQMSFSEADSALLMGEVKLVTESIGFLFTDYANFVFVTTPGVVR